MAICTFPSVEAKFVTIFSQGSKSHDDLEFSSPKYRLLLELRLKLSCAFLRKEVGEYGLARPLFAYHQLGKVNRSESPDSISHWVLTWSGMSVVWMEEQECNC